MKKIFLPAFIAMSFLYVHAQNNYVKEYINTYKELAINEMIRTGIPASIILAQGILETEAGQSELVKKSNNHFGIKCKAEWTGHTVYHDDDAKGECFRSYSTAADSYRDHSDFLRNRSTYASLFKIDPTDYEGWSKGLKKAGYATNPIYSQKLNKIIADNGLQTYTLLALQREKQKEQNPFAQNNNPAENGLPAVIAPDNISLNTNNNANSFAKNKNESFAKAAQTFILAPSYPVNIFEINQTKVIFARSGTSLFALANNYNISYKKLLDFNELTDNEILDKDQLIFLAKKPKKGFNEIHIVGPHETIENIAQTEGIRLESLLEYNHLIKGVQPATGEKIYLQTPSPVTLKVLVDNNDVTAHNNN